MKRLCIVLLVLLGHQALSFPKKKQQNSIHKSVNMENLTTIPNPGVPTEDNGTTPENPEIANMTTGVPMHTWDFIHVQNNDTLVQPRLGKPMAPQVLFKQKIKQHQQSILNSVPVNKIKDQVKNSGQMISDKMRQSRSCVEFNSDRGSFSYPTGAPNGGNYQNDLDIYCNFTTSKRIEITFTAFSTEANYDFLVIRNGDNIESFSGAELPNSVQINPGSVLVQFTSDFSITSTGFALYWEPLDEVCGGEYISSTGTINFPLNGGNYTNEENCIWIINASEPITITFVRFDTEQSYDFLYIRNGGSSSSPLLESLSGDSIPRSIPSPVEITANAAFLRFTSDYSVVGTGFELNWEPTPTYVTTTTIIPPPVSTTTPEPGCGGEYTSDTGIINFPSNDGNYQNNEDCSWTIQISPYYSGIEITFERFDTELGYDFLYVRDDIFSDSFSGDSLPSPIQITENTVYLRFTSDHSITSTGFVLSWKPRDIFSSTSSERPESPITTTDRGYPITSSEPSGGSDCACGQANREIRIVNGVETEENEYPWQAAMIYSGSTTVFCGASVIGSKHILTAAHCTQAVTDYSLSYQVLVGAHGLTTAASSQLILDASRFIQHADYDYRTVDNDISIIVLRDHIDFTSSEVRPVCLPDNDDSDYDDVTATVSGWGAIKSGGSQPDVLLEVDVPTMSNTQCRGYYGASITDNMLCAGYEEGGKDSCQGDSGGPLVFESTNGHTQIGVVSWGYGCAEAGYPGVYARVTKYLSWISANSASSNTCPAA